MKRHYWTFYWPLAITGVVMLLGRQFENGVLAKYPDAERELATFALAASIFSLLNACLVFVPHMTNVLGRTQLGRRRCLRFTVTACGVLMLPLLAAAYLPWGRAVIPLAFDMDDAMLDVVVLYLRLVTPLLLVFGLSQFGLGILVQMQRTGLVTLLNAVQLGTVVAVLALGVTHRWAPVHTVTSAMIVAGLVQLGLIAVALRVRPPHLEEDATPPEYSAILRFFWPVAMTSLMFALSRPVMFAFVSRGPDAIATIAAMRVAFDCALLFHNPCNQFRHLLVTFGHADARGVRRFMTRIMLCLTAAMVLVAFTPLLAFLLENVVGVGGATAARAVAAVRVLCLTPVVITIRNYYHGQLMIQRRTRGMAAGAAGRIALIVGGSAVAASLGRINHVVAAALLLASFGAEAVISRLFVRRPGVLPG